VDVASICHPVDFHDKKGTSKRVAMIDWPHLVQAMCVVRDRIWILTRESDFCVVDERVDETVVVRRGIELIYHHLVVVWSSTECDLTKMHMDETKRILDISSSTHEHALVAFCEMHTPFAPPTYRIEILSIPACFRSGVTLTE
jgi:hypothetical protein